MKPFDRSPRASAPDPRGEDGPLSNIGSGMPREVRDRKLPTELDPECMQSAMRGGRDKGLNRQSQLESLRDLNQAPEIDGSTDSAGEFDNQDLSGLGGRGRD